MFTSSTSAQPGVLRLHVLHDSPLAYVQMRTRASCQSSRMELTKLIASLAQRTLPQHSDSALLNDDTFCVEEHVSCVFRRAVRVPASMSEKPSMLVIMFSSYSSAAPEHVGGRLKTKRCRSLFSVTWVCFPSQAILIADHASVQHKRFGVVTWPEPSTLCTRSILSLSCWVTQSRSSSLPAMMKSSPSTTMSKSSGLVGQLLALGNVVSTRTFCTKCCQTTDAGYVPYMQSFTRQHWSVPTSFGGFT